MIHQYKLNGYNIVLDVFSGSVHITDDAAYDAIRYLEEGKSRGECFSGTVKRPARKKKIKARGIGGARIEIPAFSAMLFEIKQGT